MAFEKKSQDPWDRKPETRKAPPVPAPETSKPPESKKGPLDSLRAWNERRRAEKEEARRLPPESCPWCGQEMEQGYLYTGRDKIYWSPGGPDSSTIFFGAILGDGIQINDSGRWAACKTSWLCRNCKKMVFDMPEDAFSTTETDTDDELREEDS